LLASFTLNRIASKLAPTTAARP